MFAGESEIESLKALVGKHFSIYEVKVHQEAAEFRITFEPGTLEKKFDAMRIEVIAEGYIPIIRKERGEHILIVHRRPERKFWSNRVNVALLVITIGTTIFAGAVYWSSYDSRMGLDATSFAMGTLFFAFPLLLMLGVHEMGHYVMAKRHKVAASLPFFIPSVPPLGTFGAVISMRDPIPSRRALLDIGASGPLAGLAVAIPITIIGLLLTGSDPRPIPPNIGGSGSIGSPLLFEFLKFFFPVPEDTLIHPTLFAGWVGLFVTALNLLPAGQLDGGHIARALLGDRARFLSYGAIILMLILGSLYIGWLFIAFLIILLGMRHPPPLNDITGLDRKRLVVGALAGAVLVASFVPIPIEFEQPDVGFEFRAPDIDGNLTSRLEVDVSAGDSLTITFAVVNTGNVLLDTNLSLAFVGALRNDGWRVDITSVLWQGNASHPSNITGDSVTFSLNSSEGSLIELSVDVPPGTSTGSYDFPVKASAVGTIEGIRIESIDHELTISLNVV